MDAIHDTDTLDGTAPAFREYQAIRCLEAAAGMLASPCRALTCAEIGALQTASRSAANPQLRALARQVLDLWADEREPALAALVAGDVCDGGANIVRLDSRRPYDPLRASAFEIARRAQLNQQAREGADTGRPCDTEQPA